MLEFHRRRRDQRGGIRGLLEWVGIVVGAVLVALLVKTFLIQAFRIPSSSMEQTLQVGDRVMVNKLSYRFGTVEPGDVVVFRRPDGASSDPSAPEDLIKRVVGVGGDTLTTLDGRLQRNGEFVEEPYLEAGVITTGIEQPVTVPDGEIWVMGDNRTNSSDSRLFGPIPESSIVGRAEVVMWPPGRFRRL